MTDTALESPTEMHYRIWSEFHEMPGLRMTQDQMCRLVGGNRADVVKALAGLVDAGVLRQVGPYYIRADFGRYTA
jgi:beta-phosphoglucomutase-like phosphatase (HAD superfamily)